MATKSFFFENGPRAVMLMHAYSSTPNDVRMLGRALERENYTVYAPMFSGHGTKEPEDILNTSASVWEQDAKEGLEFLRSKGYKDIAAFGLSLGGIIAAKMLLEDNDIIAGGTFCSPVMYFDRGNNVREEFLLFVKMMKKRAGYSAAEIEVRMPEVERKLDQQLGDLSELTKSMETRYSEIKKSVFIAQAVKDELIDPQISVDFKNALTQAKVVDFHWYENSKHVVTVSDDRKELQEDITNFLAHLDWNGG